MPATEIAVCTVLDITMQSDADYQNPLADVSLTVRFVSPSGEEHPTDAFWDGGKTWRVRFSPNEIGNWQWQSECSDTDNAGLHGQTGGFQCVPYEGDNPLYEHGALELSDEGTNLRHADATPYFWLSDTAWNGVLRARPEDWDEYLRARAGQHYTAIQFVSTQWRGCTADPHGDVAFSGAEPVHINPQFFQRLDPKVAAINRHGLIAAPVMLWALQETDPGQALSEGDAIRIAKYIKARWGAYQVVWFLGGDGHYEGERAERWRRIGRAVFPEPRRRLVTMHPCGQSWVGDEFRKEPWFDVIGYQSGHGDSDDHLRWLVEGPPAGKWLGSPPLPVINLEPNYETHPSYHSDTHFTDREVRRAAYWSLLVSPTAGVSFGHNSIWVWPYEPEVPEGHDSIGTVGPWREGLDTPGVRSMTRLVEFFEDIHWRHLRPAQYLLVNQPGDDDPADFVAVAASEDYDVVVAYLPTGGSVSLETRRLTTPLRARWYDPRKGGYSTDSVVSGDPQEFTAPDDNDWLLLLRR